MIIFCDFYFKLPSVSDQKVKDHDFKFKLEQKHGKKHGSFHGLAHPYAYGGLKVHDF